MSNSKSKKGKEENKIKDKIKHQERKKEDRRQHARGTRIHQARKERGGGGSAKTKYQNNRIRHQGKQGSEKKSEEGDTRNKSENDKTKGQNERKRNREWNTETDEKKGEGKR